MISHFYAGVYYILHNHSKAKIYFFLMSVAYVRIYTTNYCNVYNAH